MSHRNSAEGEHLNSEGYLEYIDHAGFFEGTVHDLCLAAIRSKTESRPGVKVT